MPLHGPAQREWNRRYVQRLSDDGPFLDLTIEVQQFYLSKNQLKAAARMAFRILEHVYFKHDSLLNEERRRSPKVDAYSMDVLCCLLSDGTLLFTQAGGRKGDGRYPAQGVRREGRGRRSCRRGAAVARGDLCGDPS